MLGHKRGQCSPVKSPTVVPKVEPKDNDADEVTLAMKDLNLQAFVTEDGEATIRTPRKRQSNKFQAPKAESLFSFTTDDNAAIDNLAKPGIMSDAITEDDRKVASENLDRWFDKQKKFMSTPTRSAKRTPRESKVHEMQEFDPLSDMLFSEVKPKAVQQRRASPSKIKKEQIDEQLTGESNNDERELLDFVEERSKKPAGSVYTIPAKDVKVLQEKAKKLNIPVEVVQTKGDAVHSDDGEVCVLVGKKGESLEDALKRTKDDARPGRSLVGTALKSGAVGVVATWMYLAFS
jgi:hypothetical protein